MITVIIERSDRKDKKYQPVINGKKIPFGAAGYSDYTIHQNVERRNRYIARHARMGEDWSNPLTGGFYSRWLTWNLPTLQASVADMNKRFKHLGYHFVLVNL